MNDVLLAKHFDVLIMIGHVGMLWWVSSTVMCMSLIIHTLKYDYKKVHLFYTTGICILIGLFFLSIITYGIMISSYVNYIKDALFLSCYFDASTHSYSVEPLFNVICYGHLIGTTSFVLMLVGWIYVLHSK